MIDGASEQVAVMDNSALHVAALLPATAPKPEPVRRINFLKAFLFGWLRPKLYGPHLAVGSGYRVFLAHVLTILACGVVSVLAIWLGGSRTIHDLHTARVATAKYIIEVAIASASNSASWMVPLLILGFIPVIEIGILVLSVLAMPWCAGGDSAVSVWKRSVKNIYWMSTSCIVGVFLINMLVRSFERPYWQWPSKSLRDEIMMCIWIFLFGAWLVVAIRAWLVGAGRYVGEPDGPAFSPREPRCDECGYLIRNLRLETNCPECGTPVCDSLPGGRRRPTGWQQNEFQRKGWLDAMRLQVEVLRGTELFRRLPVHEGFTTARHFWWVTYLMVVCSTLLVFAVYMLGLGDRLRPDDTAPISLFLAVGPFLLQFAVMSLACLWAQFRMGIKDYRVSAIACYYSSPLLWPPAILLLVWTMLTFSPLWGVLQETPVVPVGKMTLNADGVLALLFLSGLVALIVWCWLRLCRALQAVRYANV